jgi:3-oxoacid CoA-transferase B subunit
VAWTREEIAKRIASDIPDGWYVNIGVGIPTLIPTFIPAGREVIFQSENGVLGMKALGPNDQADPDLIDAGKQAIGIREGGCFFDSSLSFAMIRGRHIDLGVVGALQVSEDGDIANWRTDKKMIGGIGGAADVCMGVRNLWVAMSHTSEGRSKLVRTCSFPLTARRVVSRVYTDLAVLERHSEGWHTIELAPGVAHGEVTAFTEFTLATPRTGG